MSDEGWRRPRPIVERIVVKGKLVLQTPAHFGSGDSDPFSHVDMTLVRDPLEGKPLLPGASIAGALRNYLRERHLGYFKAETREQVVTELFGVIKGSTEGVQSPLIIYDALTQKESPIELRDGVKIDPKSRTAEDKAKFDMEVLAAGTVFSLHFELVVEQKQRESLVKALTIALQGLEKGDIHLGARKQRGLGQVIVKNWQVWEYKLTSKEGLLGWLTAEHPDLATPFESKTGPDIFSLLPGELAIDNRHYFKLQATFALDGSLLIRSNFSYQPNSPDTVHLTTRQVEGQPAPIIPGSSFAGVIRHRALRIAQTLLAEATAVKLVNEMFGYMDQKEPRRSRGSRIRVRDTVIQNTKSLVQSRIAIDRFTGGAHSTALFDEEPVFGGEASALTLDLTLFNPAEAEIGLLLQVLKDLWGGDLPIGGESSVGRGRLQGKAASLSLYQGGKLLGGWQLNQQAGGLDIEGNRDNLEKFADKLYHFERSQAHETTN